MRKCGYGRFRYEWIQVTITPLQAGQSSQRTQARHLYINLSAQGPYQSIPLLQLHTIEQSLAFGKPPPETFLPQQVDCRSHLPAHHRHHTWTAVIFSQHAQWQVNFLDVPVLVIEEAERINDKKNYVGYTTESLAVTHLSPVNSKKNTVQFQEGSFIPTIVHMFKRSEPQR